MTVHNHKKTKQSSRGAVFAVSRQRYRASSHRIKIRRLAVLRLRTFPAPATSRVVVEGLLALLPFDNDSTKMKLMSIARTSGDKADRNK